MASGSSPRRATQPSSSTPSRPSRRTSRSSTSGCRRAATRVWPRPSTIRERFPTVGVLVLSQFLEPEYALRLLGAGVDRVGYLLKDRLGEARELLDAAHRIAAGGSAVDPAVIAELVRARRRDDRLTRLTDREREALGLIAEGHSNRAIAERLGITTKTLEGMSGTIFGKLGLEDDPDVNRRVLAVLLYLDGAGEPDGP